MTTELINYLVNKASKHGAKGYEVVGWAPPKTATEDHAGTLILKYDPPNSASETPWYDR